MYCWMTSMLVILKDWMLKCLPCSSCSRLASVVVPVLPSAVAPVTTGVVPIDRQAGPTDPAAWQAGPFASASWQAGWVGGGVPSHTAPNPAYVGMQSCRFRIMASRESGRYSVYGWSARSESHGKLMAKAERGSRAHGILFKIAMSFLF